MPGSILRRTLVHVSDPFRPVGGQDVHAVCVDGLLKEATVAYIRRTVSLLQRRWYIQDGQDFTTWNGFSLGEMVAGPALRNELLGRLGNFLAYQELIRQCPQTRHIDVRHDPGIVSDVWQHACEQQGIRFRLVEKTAYETGAKTRQRQGIRRRLTKGLTKILTGIQGARLRQPGKGPLAMLLSCGSLTRRHEAFCGALENSPHIRVTMSENALSGRTRRQISRQTHETAAKHFAGKWSRLERALHDCRLLAATQGADDHVISVLRDTYLHRLPQVAAMVETARATLGSQRPNLLIAEAQPGNEDYVWSKVARSLGITVVSITNEMFVMPRDTYNFPATSDFVLVESPLSRSWWIAKGFNEDSIFPVRARFLDTSKRESSEGDKFEVLCTLKRYAPDVMDVSIEHLRGFVLEMMAIARARPDIHVVLKFHPGTPRLEGQASFTSQLAFVNKHAPANVEVAPLGSDLLSYLDRADCVACPSFSFTVFEALAHNVPCILAPPRSAILDQCPLFDAMKEHSRVTDLNNLGAKIDAVRWGDNEIPTHWSEGVLYSAPNPIDVVEQLLQTLNQQRLGVGTAA